MSFLLILAIVFVLDAVLSYVLSIFIPSAVLINMIISFIFSFGAAFFSLPRGQKSTFYKNQDFYRNAGITFIILLVITLFMALI